MRIDMDLPSALLGLVCGALCVGAVWFGLTLDGRAQITQQMLAQARCDASGFVSITFIDGSQFTCTPAPQLPPTSRAEAARRWKK